MRKSSLILLLATAFVLSLAAASFSADSIPDITPAGCDDYTYGLQIKYGAPANHSCPTFDYELGSEGWLLEEGGECYEGYCSKHSVEGVILQICDCEDLNDILITAAQIPTPVQIGFRLTIVGEGVYWSDANFSKDADYIGNQVLAVDSFTTPEYEDSHGCLTFEDPEYVHYEPAGGSYLWSYEENCNEECCFSCKPGLATVIETELDYEFTLNMINDRYLLIDMPAMVWDSEKVSEDDVVKVKIEIIYKECDPCGVENVCEYIVDVGTFTECKSYPCGLCVPYMVTNAPGIDAWWTGVALTNVSDAELDVKITVISAGVSDTYETKIAGQTVYAELLDTILDGMDDGGAALRAAAGTDGRYYASIEASCSWDNPVAYLHEGSVTGYITIGYGLQTAQGYLAPNKCTCGVRWGNGNK